MERIIQYSTILIAVCMSYIQYRSMEKIADIPKAETKGERLFLKLQPVVLLGMAVYLVIRCNTVDGLVLWKRICILALLWNIAFVDYKCHLIPNEYLVMGLILRSILFILEIFQGFSNAFLHLTADLTGSVCMLIFCLLIRFLSRKGLGMGDVKLFAVLPLFLGTLDSMEAVFYSLIIVFIEACFCLLTKKKSKKDVLPFAPAILGGTWLLIMMAGR